jgi:polyisoprenoid-binding protein YceI
MAIQYIRSSARFRTRTAATGVLLLAFITMHEAADAAPRLAPPVTWPAPDAVLRSGTLSFVGHSTVGTFVGTTAAVSGVVIGSSDVQTARGWVSAPVATISTRNALRDRDLRATMQVAKYPTIRFDLDGVRLSSPAPADTVRAVLHGSLSIHGVVRDVTVPATLVSLADTIHVAGTFPLDLADYGIRGLTRLLGTLRMHRNIEVSLDLRFVATSDTTRGDRYE